MKVDLDSWATNTGPAGVDQLRHAAWEYTNPGALSSGGPGPTNAALQALIPVNIQKARFNLYLVYNDGSAASTTPSTF